MYSASSFTSYANNTVTNLSPGTFTAKIWVKGTGNYNYCSLTLNGVSVAFTPNGNWTQITVSNISVK